MIIKTHRAKGTPRDQGRKKAEIILMGRIKYQEAAGLEVKRRRPPLSPAPSKAELVKLYVREGRSVRDVAAALGCSKDAVHKALREYGIRPRPKRRTSRLAVYGVAEFRRRIKQDGLRVTARASERPGRPVEWPGMAKVGLFRASERRTHRPPCPRQGSEASKLSLFAILPI